MNPQQSPTTRVLLYDIESSPIISFNWGIWEQNAIEVIHDWQILCFSYKWLGEKKIRNIAQWDFKGYKPGIENLNDLNVVKELRDLFDEADIVVAHNGNSFDQKKSQARMMVHNLPPPTPYKQIDTKLEAKRAGAFTSNKLDFLNRTFGFEGKVDAGGFATWKGCISGDKKAQKRMSFYNNKDVVELEKLYLYMLPWMKTHPTLYPERPDACPKCGGVNLAPGQKYASTRSGGRYQYFRCRDCGSPFKARLPEPMQKDERPLYV